MVDEGALPRAPSSAASAPLAKPGLRAYSS